MFRIDLPELGADQYVQIKDPKFLSWGVQKSITALVSDDKELKEIGSQLGIAEKIAVALIKEGNVLNEDGVPFVFPLNNETVLEIPSCIIEKVALKFAELKGATDDRKN